MFPYIFPSVYWVDTYVKNLMNVFNYLFVPNLSQT